MTILIKYLFYHHVAEEILNLHIRVVGEGDQIAWHYDKNGMFSIKSTYRPDLNLKDCKGEAGMPNTVGNEDRRVWDVIWKAKVPQKIRIFAW